ncbi:MAG: signal peptidase II [Treponemataceae bacterium]|nr:MAG: signal peptidase II [Treponemataceae bacterium]
MQQKNSAKIERDLTGTQTDSGVLTGDTEDARKYLPFLLTFFIFFLDQATKYAVQKYIPLHAVGLELFSGLLRIIHVKNTGIAFSVGQELPFLLRRFLFAVFPTILLIVVSIISFRSPDFTRLQRRMIAGIIGGGLGNLFDRFFRTDGVIDFIDVKFFGLFGLERFPTFNVADTSVIVFGIILIASFLIGDEGT